ncbi:hypothetical protein ACEQ8H_007005 [Pleosporales sp. CAS-2024a]
MSSVFGDALKAKSLLDFQRILSPTAGVRVSPLCLGAMNFGDQWEAAMGKCDKKTSFDILDHFYDQGGNFIDTANNYQNEESEIWLGEWMTSRKNRDSIVLATKFTTCFPDPATRPHMAANYAGNSTKSLRVSVEASLKKLQTDYIDLLYVHWWDFTTSIPELMQSLNMLVNAGKVLYLGISDTPAWVVTKANEYARNHGLRPFSVYQGRWSAAQRDFERDIIPMARDEGMALCPWGVLGGGKFTTEQKRKEQDSGRGAVFATPSEADIKVSKKLEQVASKKGTQLTSIALAYVRSKYPYVYPIVGGRKMDHLKGNIEALGIELSDDEVNEIDSATDFDVGFPMNFLFASAGKYNNNLTSSHVGLLAFAGNLEVPEHLKGPKPHGLQGFGKNDA